MNEQSPVGVYARNLDATEPLGRDIVVTADATTTSQTLSEGLLRCRERVVGLRVPHESKLTELPDLSAMNRLWLLEVRANSVRDFRGLENVDGLRDVTLRAGKDPLPWLQRQRALKRLWLIGGALKHLSVNVSQSLSLQKCEHLERIEGDIARIMIEGGRSLSLSCLANLRGLRATSVLGGGNNRVEAFAELSRVTSVEHIVLCGSRELRQADPTPLLDLPSLKFLFLDVSLRHLEAIAPLFKDKSVLVTNGDLAFRGGNTLPPSEYYDGVRRLESDLNGT